MKTIKESIIGRKGVSRDNAISSIRDLKNHDIVILDDDEIFMVLTDPDEIENAGIDPKWQEYGILFCAVPGGRNWASLTNYNDDLIIIIIPNGI